MSDTDTTETRAQLIDDRDRYRELLREAEGERDNARDDASETDARLGEAHELASRLADALERALPESPVCAFDGFEDARKALGDAKDMHL